MMSITLLDTVNIVLSSIDRNSQNSIFISLHLKININRHITTSHVNIKQATVVAARSNQLEINWDQIVYKCGS